MIKASPDRAALSGLGNCLAVHKFKTLIKSKIKNPITQKIV